MDKHHADYTHLADAYLCGGLFVDRAAAFAVLHARPVPLVIIVYHFADMRGDELAKAIIGASPTTKVC